MTEGPHNSIFNWNPALRGSYRKGMEAYFAGDAITECPYRNKRTPRGHLTWSRSFIYAWEDGWNDAKRDEAQARITLLYLNKRNQK